MKNKNLVGLMILLVLTVITAVFSIYRQQFNWIIYFVLVLSGIKFLIVVFQFMELKKAHVFWKMAIAFYVILFMTVISGLLI